MRTRPWAGLLDFLAQRWNDVRTHQKSKLLLMAVNATKLPPFGGVCLDEKIEVMSVVPVWSIYIKTFWTQENHSGKSFHQACSMSSSSSAIEIFRPKNLQKKTSFAKQKNDRGFYSVSDFPSAAPGSWKHDMMKLYLNTKQLRWWNWWYGFASIEDLSHLSSKKGVGFQTLVGHVLSSISQH